MNATITAYAKSLDPTIRYVKVYLDAIEGRPYTVGVHLEIRRSEVVLERLDCDPIPLPVAALDVPAEIETRASLTLKKRYAP